MRARLAGLVLTLAACGQEEDEPLCDEASVKDAMDCFLGAFDEGGGGGGGETSGSGTSSDGWDSEGRPRRDTGMATTAAAGDAAIVSWSAVDQGNRIDWEVTTSGSFEGIYLEIIENGDPNFSCGPGKDVVCGVWQENHNAFVQLRDGWVLSLVVEEDAVEQLANTSTLFDSASFSSLTVYILADGPTDACMTGGYNPDYYAGICP